MTRDDEDMIRFLCMRAAILMENAASMARWLHESHSELLDIVETMERHASRVTKLIAAALALTEN